MTTTPTLKIALFLIFFYVSACAALKSNPKPSQATQTNEKKYTLLEISSPTHFKSSVIIAPELKNMSARKYFVVNEIEKIKSLELSDFTPSLRSILEAQALSFISLTESKHLLDTMGEFNSEFPILGKYQNLPNTLSAAKAKGATAMLQLRLEFGDTPSLKRMPKKTIFDEFMNPPAPEDVGKVWSAVLERTVVAYFTKDYKTKEFRNVPRTEYKNSGEDKFAVVTPKVFLSGRILDTSTQSLLGAFEYECDTYFNASEKLSLSIPVEMSFDPVFSSLGKDPLVIAPLPVSRTEFILAPDTKLSFSVLKSCYERVIRDLAKKI